MDAEVCEAIHRDVLAGQPAALRRALDALTGLSEVGESLRGRLLAWDQRFTTDSVEAAAYVDVRTRFVQTLADRPRFTALAEHPLDDVYAAWTDVPTEIWLSLPGILSERGRALLPEIDEVLAAAVEHVAARPASLWGERHVFAPFHPLRRSCRARPGCPVTTTASGAPAPARGRTR